MVLTRDKPACAPLILPRRGDSGNASVTPRDDETGIRAAAAPECGTNASRCGAILKHSERILGAARQTRGLGIEGHRDGWRDCEAVRRVFGAHSARASIRFDANELVAKTSCSPAAISMSCGTAAVPGPADVVDHHGHDEGMRVPSTRRNEGRAFRGCSVGWPGQFADRQVLKAPFPTGERAREPAQAGDRHRRRKILMAALTAGGALRTTRLEQFKTGTPMCAQGAHGRQKLKATRLRKQQSQTIEKAVWIALQKPPGERIRARFESEAIDEDSQRSCATTYATKPEIWS